MRYIKIWEEFISKNIKSEKELSDKLTEFEVPIDTWGQGQAKTVKHLFDELQHEECHIEDRGGFLVRYLEFVGVRIFYKKGEEILYLKEDRQEFNDGRTRKREMPSSVSEKMKFGENPQLAAIRGIKEELGIYVKPEQLIKQRDLNYRGGSLSYPGLTSKYKGHQFTCYLTEQQFNPEGYIEKQEDKSTFFTWVKYEA